MGSGPGRRAAQEHRAMRDRVGWYARTRDLVAREDIILAHRNLAEFLARKFAYRGEPLEDLIQVAHLGLLQALERYDPSRGAQFSTFATTTILGELKRYFRDKSWAIHVPRRLRERNNLLMRMMNELTASNGRSPTLLELAETAGISLEETVEALEVGRAYRPASLDAGQAPGHADDVPLGDSLGRTDSGFDRLEDRETLEQALGLLPDREERVLRMRYYENRSQADIAQQLSISQMHVSRIQRAALSRLRELIEV